MRKITNDKGELIIDEVINHIGCLLTGIRLDKKQAETLCRMVVPLLIRAGVVLK